MEETMAQYFQTEQWLDSYIGTARDIITKPAEFFDTLPKAEGYGPSLMFFTITLAIPLLVYALMSLGMALLAAPVVWLLSVVMTWIWAWYLGWAVRTFVKQPLDTVNAFQICAYANVPMLLSWVPLVGIVVTIWTIVLEWMALTRSCNASSGAALAILLIPLLIVGISGAILAVLIGIYMSQQGMHSQMM